MYNNEPLVSIIIPVYNGSNYVEEAIKSALNQTYKNIEIIVINDGSNDYGKTSKAIYPYLDKIKYFEKNNGGVSSALNYGIDVMKGEYFSWLSHDDLYEKSKIEKQINYLVKNKLLYSKTIIFNLTKFIDKDGYEIKKVLSRNIKPSYNPTEAYNYLLSGGSFNGCSLLIPKNAFDNNFFDVNYKYIQDWKMWVQLSQQNFKFIAIPDYLTMMRMHDEQQTVKISSQYKKELYLFSLENNSQIEKLKVKERLIYLKFLAKNNFLKDVVKVKNRVLKTSKFGLLEIVKLNLKIYYWLSLGFFENILRKFLYICRRKFNN